jgi:hypothetical protein
MTSLLSVDATRTLPAPIAEIVASGQVETTELFGDFSNPYPPIMMFMEYTQCLLCIRPYAKPHLDKLENRV